MTCASVRRNSCRGLPGKGLKRLRKTALRFRRILARQYAFACRLPLRRRSAGGRRSRIERPAQMFARMFDADARTMMRDHLVVQGLRQRELLGQRWIAAL